MHLIKSHLEDFIASSGSLTSFQIGDPIARIAEIENGFRIGIGAEAEYLMTGLGRVRQALVERFGPVA